MGCETGDDACRDKTEATPEDQAPQPPQLMTEVMTLLAQNGIPYQHDGCNVVRFDADDTIGTHHVFIEFSNENIVFIRTWGVLPTVPQRKLADAWGVCNTFNESACWGRLFVRNMDGGWEFLLACDSIIDEPRRVFTLASHLFNLAKQYQPAILEELYSD